MTGLLFYIKEGNYNAGSNIATILTPIGIFTADTNTHPSIVIRNGYVQRHANNEVTPMDYSSWGSIV